MKNVFILLFLITSISLELSAQNGTPQNAGARGAAMGNASVTFTDINSAFSNQAGLAFLEELNFTAYGEKRFLAEGLNSFLFAAAYPIDKVGTIGLTVNYFGFNAYNEQKIGLSYARKLAKNFSLGAQFDYLATRIPDYGTASSFTFELGMLAKLSKQVTLAAHTYNPINSKVAGLDRLPNLVKIGVGYSPSDKVTLTGELEKDIYNFPLVGKIGVEYRPMKALAIRAGFAANQPTIASFGLGLYLQGLRIDVASSYHQILGLTPSVSISYGLNPKKVSSTPEETNE
jgi:hypothetical protein